MKTHCWQYFLPIVAVAPLLIGSTAFAKTENSVAESPTPIPPSPVTLTGARSTARAVPAISPLATSSPFADVQLRMRDLQSQMDNVFAQAFRDLGNSFGETGFASSVDLRDQKDQYVARIYLPNGDTSKVNARVENGKLDITMNAAENKNGATASENFEQVITLPEPVRADQLQIQRKSNLVVITVPKTTPTAVAHASPPANQAPVASTSPSPKSAAENWDRRMIESMQGMEARMNQLFQNAFPNTAPSEPNTFQLGSAVNVEDQKNKYVVHFTLPSQDISNVTVKFENGELHLTAQEKNETNSKNVVERGRYEEMVTLPGPVNESQMHVNHQASAVVVTLPKA